MIVSIPPFAGHYAFSASGRPAPGFSAPARCRGFTLIEMLVVLLIMGLLVGLVSAITRPDDRALLQMEARRMAALLDFATAKPRLSGKPVAWTAEGAAYRFWQFYEDTGWTEIRDGDELRTRTLPPGMQVSSLRIEARRPQDGMRLEFMPFGTLAFVIELSLGAERYAVVASPAGDVRAMPITGTAYAQTVQP